MPLETGEALGPYSIQALLGRGGMGEVYRALDTRLGRVVALKVIAPGLLGDPNLHRRFEIEARAASALNHPSVVTVYDIGETRGVSWIAFEWVEGHSLRQALTNGSLPIGETIAIARQISSGLAAAHSKGVVHRDLKPENIMLTVDGRAKIVDFGLARQTMMEVFEDSSSKTAAMPRGAPTFEGAILGTVGYMSPEQATGRVADFRSDQFSFGLILYEMLAGQPAFSGASGVETLSAIIRDEPLPVSTLRGGVPAALQQLISRCLSKRPEQRFPSTTELAAALERLALDRGSQAEVSPDAFTLQQTDVRGTSLSAPPPLPSRKLLNRRRVLTALGTLTLLTLAAAGWNRFHVPSGVIHSLAVLPLENATNDPETEYLASGVTESLIDQLSRIPSLKVMARSTVMRFKGAADPQSVGKQLGVGAVLSGRISKRGPQLTVSVELVDISNGARLWGRIYDRPAADLLNVQGSIATEIADSLRLTLTGAEKKELAFHGTADPEAYQLYLRARFLLQHDTEEDDVEARRLYLQALERDPQFVQARVGVATTYLRSGGNGYAPPIEGMLKAEAEARKALAVDPENFGARAIVAARSFLFDWDWAAAEREFVRLASDPRAFLGLQYHGSAMYFWATGRTERSIALLEQALRLDPANVESRVMLANFLGHSGRLNDATLLYQAIAGAEPLDPRPLFGLANVFRRRGDAPKAIAALRKAYQLSEDPDGIDALATAQTESDYDKAQKSVARKHLESLKRLASERYVSPLDLARLHVQIGDTERAFEEIQKALTERSAGLVFLKVDQVWDPIRHDGRFAAIVRRVGIP